MKKWIVVSTILTIPMFLEDFGLFVLGRYTTIPMWQVALGIVGLGLLFGALARAKRIRQFLGE